MVLHRDSKWYQQWQEFKDNNPVVTGKVMTFTTLLFSYVPAMIMTDKINAVLQKNFCGLFTFHIKREMRCFHFEVIQWWRRNEQGSVLQLQSCC